MSKRKKAEDEEGFGEITDEDREDRDEEVSDDRVWVMCDDEFVLKTSADLIEKHHRVRCMLSIDDIGFLWNIKDLGDRVLGKCSLVSEKFKPFFKKPIKFLILLDLNKWNILSTSQRIGLLDHELAHCDFRVNEKTGEVKPKIRKHDTEEFIEVIERNGAYLDDLVLIKDIFNKQ